MGKLQGLLDPLQAFINQAVLWLYDPSAIDELRLGQPGQSAAVTN